MSDGGSASKLWMQIVADVLGEPLNRLDGHPGSCLGAAWTAAIGVGVSTDWKGASAWVKLKDVISHCLNMRMSIARDTRVSASFMKPAAR